MTPEQRFKCMSHNRAKNTGPELILRHALWGLGFRYRTNDKRLPGKPDIVLPKYHTVIFVHGCFWHGHKDCSNYTVPKTNTEFWMVKIARNQERDQETWRKLEAKGWYVLIVWECELKKARFDDTLNYVASAIKQNGQTYDFLQAARKKARALYAEEQKLHKDHEAALKLEIRDKFPHR
ncbi:MAG: DNA mismatch endonuclease Vsr [Bacteroidales bacterium]|nr:DNA mismatch endonuclease Vsr [Bacteroidales bacterium]